MRGIYSTMEELSVVPEGNMVRSWVKLFNTLNRSLHCAQARACSWQLQPVWELNWQLNFFAKIPCYLSMHWAILASTLHTSVQHINHKGVFQFCHFCSARKSWLEKCHQSLQFKYGKYTIPKFLARSMFFPCAKLAQPWQNKVNSIPSSEVKEKHLWAEQRSGWKTA